MGAVLPVAMTLGEPAGIGPDLALMAWRRRAADALPVFYVAGDAAFLASRARALGIEAAITAIAQPAEAAAAFATALPVIETGVAATAAPGRPDGASAPAAIAAIRRAVADVAAGGARAVVTNPVAKSVLYRAGFAHPGHTEFLAHLAAERTGHTVQPVMMLWSPKLAVVPVTIHLALSAAIAALTTELIVATCRIVAHDLRTRLAIASPRLVVSGLNPHAGEDGALGDEERTVIAPAIAALAAEGVDVRGPLSADTLFHDAMRESYDCAVCMYHDQALIPIKTLAFHDAVNVTLGLPFVRTSPDHGTAFDLAGTGRADPSSLIAALRLAARMTP
ncbi:MAG: 4-hydroxythreonine-4-phosphate dehydrogenase PdxA [Xanthobacteraceae bacterium]|nr:MAG: 4-hydroxythreonine-4-phosphate dehydrogenase PdxA [Xanthobacteraceae bacterium]